MLVTTLIHTTRPSIMQARGERAVHIGRMIRIAGRRLARRIAAWRERAALARQYDNDMAMLLQADDRMLADIGVTRSDVIAAAIDHRWFAPDRMIAAAAARRNDAINVADARHLPRVQAPATAPGSPARWMTIETTNYR